MPELTEKQKAIYDFIKTETLKTNRYQTLRTVAREFGITPCAARDHFKAIVKKGFAYSQDNTHGLYLTCLRIVENA